MDLRTAKYIQRMYFGMFPCPGARPIFVHGTDGDNNNDGYTPDRPVLTMTQAFSLATAWKGDIIYARSIGTPAGETWPIDCNKDDVTIIGWGEEANRSAIVTPSGDTASFSINAHNLTFIRLEIGAGASHAGIEVAATKWSLLVKDCWFGVQQALQDGILVNAPYDIPYLTLIDCWFGQGITRDGIRIEGAITRGQLGMAGHGNRFLDVAGIGINDVSGGGIQGVTILDNRFRLPSDTAGKAITLGVNSADCYIDGNRAQFGRNDAMGQNPWVDATGDDSNSWGLNYKGAEVVYPA